ncbi:hypothetical protein TrST_g13676 [Triparma strigata]|uniref:Uncharacterized protein n=1 Tax=Triparma strigata TaxID=1606541 RepID=A0A9W7EVJ9_9STRA|nr:hypothetical protein TrST_g13676 [Triparma strigata]
MNLPISSQPTSVHGFYKSFFKPPALAFKISRWTKWERLVPSHIDVAQHNYGGEEWVNHTPKVIAYLRSQQS